MTNKEAINEIRSCLGVNNIIMPYSDEMEAFGMAIDALKKADKYRKHDFKKDNHDLPEPKKEVLVELIWGEFTIGWIDSVEEPWRDEYRTFDDEDVVAWVELPEKNKE